MDEAKYQFLVYFFIFVVEGTFGACLLYVVYIITDMYQCKKINNTKGEIISGACIRYNPNPYGNDTGDCAIRAICKIENMSWRRAYNKICRLGKENCLIPNDIRNLIEYLGNKKYTFFEPANKINYKTFAKNHKAGKFYLFSNGHVCACVDGKLYDTFDSNKNVITFYATKETTNDINLAGKTIICDELNFKM